MCQGGSQLSMQMKTVQGVMKAGLGLHALGRGALWAGLCLMAGLLHGAALAWPGASWAWLGLHAGQPSGALQILSLAALAWALPRSVHPGAAAWRGWLFATAWLVGTFWWLYISMHTYGGLPSWLAALGVLVLAAFLALYYAAACALFRGLMPASRMAQAVLFAALWTLAELARGQWLTGFPWGAAGYAQVDLMASWAPWIGVYGLGLMAAALAYALAAACAQMLAWVRRKPCAKADTPMPRAGSWERGKTLRRGAGMAVLLVLAWSWWGGSQAWLAWAQAGTAHVGTPLRVWLLQGNIAQNEKFQADKGVLQALRWYPQQMAEAADQVRAGLPQAPQLVVAPETALPVLPQDLGPAFWRDVLRQISTPDAPLPLQVLFGLPLGDLNGRYTNSVWGITHTSAAAAMPERAQWLGGPAWRGWVETAGAHFYRYDKHHLVPFGEFIPPGFDWWMDILQMPLGSFSRGHVVQAPWVVGPQRVLPNICYEDLFGEELARSFAQPGSAPTVLVNLSNIAWFGDTVAIDQHLHISRMRALEFGRPMLRATNTGATVAIDHLGRVTHALPRLTRGRLQASVQGRSGLTMYARWSGRWGLWPLWGLCLCVVTLCGVARYQTKKSLKTSATHPGSSALTL